MSNNNNDKISIAKNKRQGSFILDTESNIAPELKLKLENKPLTEQLSFLREEHVHLEFELENAKKQLAETKKKKKKDKDRIRMMEQLINGFEKDLNKIIDAIKIVENDTEIGVQKQIDELETKLKNERQGLKGLEKLVVFYKKDKVAAKEAQDKVDFAKVKIQDIEFELENSKERLSKVKDPLWESKNAVDVAKSKLEQEKGVIDGLQKMAALYKNDGEEKREAMQKIAQTEQRVEQLQTRLEYLQVQLDRATTLQQISAVAAAQRFDEAIALREQLKQLDTKLASMDDGTQAVALGAPLTPRNTPSSPDASARSSSAGGGGGDDALPPHEPVYDLREEVAQYSPRTKLRVLRQRRDALIVELGDAKQKLSNTSGKSLTSSSSSSSSTKSSGLLKKSHRLDKSSSRVVNQLVSGFTRDLEKVEALLADAEMNTSEGVADCLQRAQQTLQHERQAHDGLVKLVKLYAKDPKAKGEAEEKVVQSESRVKRAEERVAQLEKRLEFLNDPFFELKNQIQVAEGKLNKQRKAMEGLEKMMGFLPQNERAAALAKVDQTKQSCALLEERLTALTEELRVKQEQNETSAAPAVTATTTPTTTTTTSTTTPTATAAGVAAATTVATDDDDEIVKIQEQLSNAIAAQDFENAIKLRDQLKKQQSARRTNGLQNIANIKAALAAAVEAEDFARAIELRDQLKALEADQ